MTGEEFRAFWRARHLSTLTTLRSDGTPHVTPVGVTLDPEAGIARVISSRGSRKVRNVVASPSVALCQVDGRYWSTLEGQAVIKDAPHEVAEAERRYTERYKPPRPNPERVVIEIRVTRVLGNV
jgi:PPOX class probable F420-dependent enzyme